MFHCFVIVAPIVEEVAGEVAAPISEELPCVPIAAPISIVVGMIEVAGTPAYVPGAGELDEDDVMLLVSVPAALSLATVRGCLQICCQEG